MPRHLFDEPIQPGEEPIDYNIPDIAPERAIFTPRFAIHYETSDRFDALETLIRAQLAVLGLDPRDPRLVDTPARVARMWIDFLSYDPGTTTTVFEAASVDQMVVVSNMRVWSMCEHHLLPFWCDVTVGYLAADHAIGLSKLARIAHKHAHRLQMQERLVNDIATEVKAVVKSDHVAVLGRGEHLCMTMRGIQTPHLMTSSALYGDFRDDPATRAEFMRLAI